MDRPKEGKQQWVAQAIRNEQLPTLSDSTGKGSICK
jgi:hypothetical protein